MPVDASSPVVEDEATDETLNTKSLIWLGHDGELRHTGSKSGLTRSLQSESEVHAGWWEYGKLWDLMLSSTGRWKDSLIASAGECLELEAG